jgi:hypothetical protein
MTCRLEKQMANLLRSADIDFTRPERDRSDPTTLDFYLPDFDLYIEVKQFHTDRITRQLAAVPDRKTAIMLMGPSAISDFERLVAAIRASS